MSSSTKKNQNDTNDHFDNQGETEPQRLQKQVHIVFHLNVNY